MNMLLLQNNDLISGKNRAIISGRRFEHIIKTPGVDIGSTVKVGLVNDKMGTGTILSIRDTELEMEINLYNDPPAPLPVTLLLALPRPKMMKRVLFTAASMGVKKIFLINSYRVEKSFWQSAYLEDKKMYRQFTRALEQTGDTLLPVVITKRFFKPFIEDELPEIIKGSIPLVAHPAAGAPCPRLIKEPVTLAIGPEGGFIPYEIEMFVHHGFSPVSIGKRILRVETAVPALLGHLC